jgi:hypothetical protein
MASVKVKLGMSKQQLAKLRSAKKNNRAVSIRFSNDQIFSQSGVEVEVSPEQYKKLLSASKSKAKRGATISFSASQVQSGGFLPMLLGALAGPLLGSLIGGNGIVPLGNQRGKGRGKKKM